MPPVTPAEQMPATFREWVEILARIQFGTVRIAGKNYASSRIKLVAGRLAAYADSDGTRVRPGVARLAVDLNVDYRTVRAIVAYLRGLGLLLLVRAGKGVNADEYRLSLPTDLLERDDLTVWSPARHAAEIERLRTANRGRYRPGPEGGPNGSRSADLQGPQGPADNADLQGPQGPADAFLQGPQALADGGAEEVSAGSSGTDIPGSAGSSGTDLQGPQGPATDQDRNTTTTDHPDGDLRTAVTPSRATGPATNPESPPRPKRCDHGLSGALRPDGKPACALCRVAASRGHPPPDGIAPVIALRPREAS